MDKHELVGMTLRQLIDHFKGSPESFEYYDQYRKPNSSMYPTIYYQPKVQLGDYMSTVVHDPNNSHAVVVMFNTMTNELTCYLFLKAPANFMGLSGGHAADCVMTSGRPFETLRGNYRKFKKLRDLIVAKDKEKENLVYLKKLSSVFPHTLDAHILDK